MLEKYIHRWFTAQGKFCAERPVLVLVLCVLMCVQCFLGWKHLRIEQKPEKLWVDPDSVTARDMTFFDDSFRPFFRVEEVIVTSKVPGQPNVINNEAMIELLEFIELVSFTADKDTDTTLQDLCWHPIDGKGCFKQSVLGYLQSNMTTVLRLANESSNGVNKGIAQCIKNPLHTSCYTDLGLPVEHTTVVGDFKFDDVAETVSAAAALTTFLLENSNDEQYLKIARSWEENVFLPLCDEFNKKSKVVNVYYMAQRSVQDALDSQNKASIANVAISYAVMLTYIAVALGYWSKVHSKGSVALVGIIIVGVSILVSVGVCSALNIPLTLIITDVIPFLLVAIGVDNMFIISNQFWYRCRVAQRRSGNPNRPLTKPQIVKAMSEALGEVGGTIFLAGASEGLAFSLGGLTQMPAVRAFCLYSGIAILCNLALQVTAFVSFLALDAQRAASRRYDLLPCLSHSADEDELQNPAVEEGDDDPDSPSTCEERSGLLARQNGTRQNGHNNGYDSSVQVSFHDQRTGETKRVGMTLEEYVKHREQTRDGGLYGLGRLIRLALRKYYVPFILNKVVQIVVVATFVLFSLCCLFLVCPKSELGLKQTDPVPDHSYLRAMFDAMDKYLEVGPLIYFASPKSPGDPLVNYSDPKVIEPMLRVSDELREVTPYIDGATIASWYNDLLKWVCFHGPAVTEVNPGNGCVDYRTLNFTINGTVLDEYQIQDKLVCDHTATATNIPFEWFTPFLKAFLATKQCCHQAPTQGTDVEGANTGLCGFQYGQEVIVGDVYKDHEGLLRPVPKGEHRQDSFEYIRYARVRAQTIRLANNTDFIASLSSAYNFTNTISEVKEFKDAGLSFYPYSIYFVYYSQYLDLASNAAKNVGLAIGCVTIVTFAVLSSISSTISVALSIMLILVDLVAVMAWWDIDVNAISVVNLVMCVGISVEFCAHIAVAFCGAKGSMRKRMMTTMVDMGSNVFMGITITKLLGVSILNFSPSRVFRVYYFRMYATIIIFGALHGLLFLPCLLMLIGAPYRGRDKKEDGLLPDFLSMFSSKRKPVVGEQVDATAN